MTTKLDELCVNTLRMLSVDCIEKAKSGHPGMPMGASPMAYVLWTRFLRHNPVNPEWPDRDRFILSAGHASMLLYSLLHLTGYDLSLEDLKNFRQWDSKTPGHPEYSHTPGVETTSGPLGQGFANGVGMAIAESFLASHFNQPGHNIVDHYIYSIVSDGDLMEGVSHEAASLAGHLRLGHIIYLYDDNHISIEGSTDITYTENRNARFEAYGWHVQEVEDGNDLDAIENAILTAQNEKEKPSIIAVHTHIGYGSPNKQDASSAHGEPLGPEETRLTKERLGWPVEKHFFIPDEALEHFRKAIEKGKEAEKQWRERFRAFEDAQPELAAEWKQWINRELPDNWDIEIPTFAADPKGIATRVASGKVLNSIAKHVSNLIGGSADLSPSNKTVINGEPDFQAESCNGRNIRFGVREHGMGSILNGIALYGGLIPYGGTFLIFSEYMRPPIRLAAFMGLHVIYIFTHDSIGLGEDGPTHQPVEQLASLRSIPNLTVIRPCDANETANAWRLAMASQEGPVALILTRQALPVLEQTSTQKEGLSRGAYILKDAGARIPDVNLIACGSEIHIVLDAAKKIEEKGLKVQVTSMPSWELFEKQPEEYRRHVIPLEVKAKIAIEAGVAQGWHRYTGSDGVVISIDRFGASAPAKVLFEKFGITAEKVVEKTLSFFPDT
ncbi:MAG: transketolase [Desulfobacteraceae bacterium 4484_190.1]|nr:MAG: transketolase [Desulfobacteraceae bacterium 4484_190.1]